MDDKRFDLLAKSLSTGRTRRSLLRSLVAAVGVAAFGADRASAAPGSNKGGNGDKKCYGGGSQCTNAKQCCSGTCTNRVCAPEVSVDPCAGMTCDDGNECTADSCSNGICSHNPTPGAPCNNGQGTCSSSGDCKPGVACGPAMSCPPPPSSCQTSSCDVGTSICTIYDLPSGVSCDSGAGTCDGMGNCVYPVDPCANVTCLPTGNECMGSYCGDQGQCFTKPIWGALCDSGNGICDENGACKAKDHCIGVTCPQSDNACIGYFCNSADGVCNPKVLTGAPCNGGNGVCNVNAVCDPI